ncbi:MAG: putative lipid II flippase FtsW [Oscillospiraceae bacterium]|nr:putative lipid II flippase FtsW [Oscillospiraceae bacterium]
MNMPSANTRSHRAVKATEPKPSSRHRRPPVRKPSTAPAQSGWRLTKFDIPLFLVTIVLAVFGLGMLLSASWAYAAREHSGDSYFYFRNQMMFMSVGIVVMVVISFINYRLLLNKWVLFIMCGVTVAMMLAVLFGAGGVTQGGAERWLKIGPITFQPSEILKFAMIVVIAWMAHRNPERIKTTFGAIRVAFVVGFSCMLTILQPHLSGTVILFVIGISLMSISGVRWPYTVLIIVGVLALIPLIPPIMEAAGYSYSDARMLSWRDPTADVQGDTFQTYQSLVAIGSGGWFGLGLGESRQKFSYLPASHNDFIFSVIAEELGFVGGMLVILLFVVFILRGFYIAKRAPDRFGMMLATGVTVQIGIQAFLNIAVATNTIPNTGVSLPFFSYGGTALLMQMAQIGVLLNISRQARIG